jgi:hypothetical protein
VFFGSRSARDESRAYLECKGPGLKPGIFLVLVRGAEAPSLIRSATATAKTKTKATAKATAKAKAKAKSTARSRFLRTACCGMTIQKIKTKSRSRSKACCAIFFFPTYDEMRVMDGAPDDFC